MSSHKMLVPIFSLDSLQILRWRCYRIHEMSRMPFSHLERPCPFQSMRGVAGTSQAGGPGSPHVTWSAFQLRLTLLSHSQAHLTEQQGLQCSVDCPRQHRHQFWSPWPTAVHGSSSCVLSRHFKGTLHQETHPHGAGSDPCRSSQGGNNRWINSGVAWQLTLPRLVSQRLGRLQQQTLQRSFKLGRSPQSRWKAPFARGLLSSLAHIYVNNEKSHHQWPNQIPQLCQDSPDVTCRACSPL